MRPRPREHRRGRSASRHTRALRRLLRARGARRHPLLRRADRARKFRRPREGGRWSCSRRGVCSSSSSSGRSSSISGRPSSAPGSDAVAAMWTFWRMEHEGGYHVFGVTHHTLTGAPFGWDEGNGLNIQALLAYYPGYLAAKIVGPIAAYNLVLLAGYVLSGAVDVPPGAVSRLRPGWSRPGRGSSSSSSPGTWPHSARVPRSTSSVLPLLLVALVAATRRPTWLRFGLVGLRTMASWLTSGYFGAMAWWRHACSRSPPP